MANIKNQNIPLLTFSEPKKESIFINGYILEYAKNQIFIIPLKNKFVEIIK
jgi:hypothetical protein